MSTTTDPTYRRGFLGRMLGAAAAGFMSVKAAGAQTQTKAAEGETKKAAAPAGQTGTRSARRGGHPQSR